MFAIILTVSVLGLACQELVRWLQRRLLPWHRREAA
jgi:ABC-type nitrate/sulfonate/bicarbonate transport system permease component